MVIVICKDKVKSGCEEGNVYMQITTNYQYFMRVLTGETETDLEANKFLSNGVLCFLICVLGIYTIH